jgi:hypothetical protein
MKKYLCGLAIGLAAIIGLIFLLDACTTDEAGIAQYGEPVTIRFSASEQAIAPVEEIDNLKSADANSTEVRISKDLVINTTVAADINWMRLMPTTINNNARVLLIVYSEDNTYLMHNVYSYNASTKRLVGPDITLTAGITYHFYAYSHNDYSYIPTLEYLSETGTDPSAEGERVLYGKTTVQITNTNQVVNLALLPVVTDVKYTIRQYGGNNLLFSNCEPLVPTYDRFIHTDTGAVKSAYTNRELRYNGNFTTEASQLTSGGEIYLLVNNDSVHRIIIDKLTIRDQISSTIKDVVNVPIVFNRPLLAGYKYTIYINVIYKPEPSFAASNIYWSDERQCLTFDAEIKGDNQLYQGVFFKFGSLVGISPAGAQPEPSALYVPDADTFAIEPVSRFTAYVGIPYTNTGDIVADYDNYKGDICRYISSKGYGPAGNWVTPVISMFDGDSNYTFSNLPWDTDFTSIATNGTKVISNYTTYKGTTIFPASGLRTAAGAQMAFSGFGNYWSGSVYDGTNGCYLYFTGGNAYPHYNSFRSYGFPVRCVLMP